MLEREITIHDQPRGSIDIRSPQFGHLSLPLSHLILMPRGLLGFGYLRTFALIQRASEAGVVWLLSLEELGRCFAMVHGDSFDGHLSSDDGGPRTHHNTMDSKVSRSPTSLTVPDLPYLDEPCQVFHFITLASNPEHTQVHARAPLLVYPSLRIAVHCVWQ